MTFDKKHILFLWTLFIVARPMGARSETGTMTVVDATNLTVTADFEVGVSGSSNTLQIINGGTLDNTGYDGFIGVSTGANYNTVDIVGTNSAWNTGNWYVGVEGYGNVASISAGGGMHVSSNATIGHLTGADSNRVVVSSADSVLLVESNLSIGVGGIFNELVAGDGGEIIVGGALSIGNENVSGFNTLIVDGGVVLANSVFSGGSAGRLVVSGGQLKANVIEGFSTSGSRLVHHAGEVEADYVRVSPTTANAIGTSPGGWLVGDGTEQATLRLGLAPDSLSSWITTGLQVHTNGQLHAAGLIIASPIDGSGNPVPSGFGLTSGGVIKIGDGLGILTIWARSSLFFPTSRLEIDIHGLAVGSEYDQYQAPKGPAFLDGELALTLGNDFTPDRADQFVIVEAQSVTGTFSDAPGGARIFTKDGSGSFLIDYQADRVIVHDYLPALRIEEMRPVGSSQIELDIVGLVPGVMTRIFRISELGSTALENALEMDAFISGTETQTWSGSLNEPASSYLVTQDL